MRGPSLQKATAFSAALHLTFFLLAALVLKQSKTLIVPSPYTVSLVGPAGSASGTLSEKEVAEEQAETRVTEAVKPAKQVEKTVRDTKEEQKRLQEQLAALDAKKKIERIVKVRSIVSVGGTQGKNSGKPPVHGTGAGAAQGTMFDSYYAKITGQIRQEWVYPDAGEKNLEAVIAVKIARDGTINVQGIEKSSGNALFDRSALRALAKASPVQSPPYEMEIGLRFYP